MENAAWVLFDLDGTLTRSEEGIWNSARHTLKTMGYPEPDAATLRKFIGPPLVWSFRELIGMSEEQALQAQEIYRGRYNTVGLFENRVYPGIQYTLRCLKKAGFRLGVVTGKMATDGISVSAMLQKDADPDGRATLIFITHSASEKAVQRMLKSLNPDICRVENVIRVES